VYKRQGSIKEYKAMLATYRRKVGPGISKEDLAKVGLQQAWTILTYLKVRPDKRELKQEYKDALKQLAADYPDTPEGVDAVYYLAEAMREDARSAGEFVTAAEAYEKVTPASSRYGRARYLRAICFVNAYKWYEGRGKADDPKATSAVVAAAKILEGLLKTKPAPGTDTAWHMEAARALVDLYVDLGEGEKAEAVLRTLEQMYPDAAGADPGILVTRVNVCLRVGRLDDALKARDALAAHKDAKVKDVFNATLKVADEYYARSVRLKDDAAQAQDDAVTRTKMDEADKLDKVTAGLLAKALPQVTEAARDKVRGFSLIANRSFKVKSYVTAIDAVDKLEELYTDEKREEDDLLWNLRMRKVECYDRMNHWPAKALELLKRIEQHPTYGNLVEIKMLRAAVLESKRQWEEALKIWNELGAGLEPGTPNWFKSRLHRAKCHYKLGNVTRGNQIIDGLQALHPGLGGPEMKKQFLDLRAEFNK